MQEAQARAALAEAESAQQREADERGAAVRAQKKKAKKARRREAAAAGVGCVRLIGLSMSAWTPAIAFESAWDRLALMHCRLSSTVRCLSGSAARSGPSSCSFARWRRTLEARQAARRRSAMHSSYHCQRQAPRIKEETCTWHRQCDADAAVLGSEVSRPNRADQAGGGGPQPSSHCGRGAPVSTRDILHRTAPSKQRLSADEQPMAANSNHEAVLSLLLPEACP